MESAPMTETAILQREPAHLFTGSRVGVLPGMGNDVYISVDSCTNHAGGSSAGSGTAAGSSSDLYTTAEIFYLFVGWAAMEFIPTFGVGRGGNNIESHGVVAGTSLCGPKGQKKFVLLWPVLTQAWLILRLLCSYLVIIVKAFVNANPLPYLVREIEIFCLRQGRGIEIVRVLKLLSWVLAFHALVPVFSISVGIRRVGDNTLLDNFGQSHGRMLLAINHDSFGKNDILSVDLRKIMGNDDTFEQQKNWSSHNSSEIPAVLYVLTNGKHVKINCNLIADQKALAQWISIENSDQLGKVHGETTKMQNKTEKSHLPEHKKHKRVVVVAIASAVSFVLCSIIGLLLWCMCCKREHRNELVEDKTTSQLELFGGIGPRRFSYHELAAATNNFIDENKLGQGGFGPVYRGYLRDQNRHVAVKVLSQEPSGQGLREFEAEVKVMTQLRHRNVVQLVGWCSSNNQLLLVYELMTQGSLDKRLYNAEKVLSWQERYNIILGLGSALLYLHQDCEMCIVHGDIKSANVMLDASLNAKLGDFGLARLIAHGAEPQTTQVIAGTRGYIDPVFINNGWRCTELDVYSFGILLLEVASAKRPASGQPTGASSLLAWVRDLHCRGMILEAADGNLNSEFNRQEMERVLVMGLWCAHQDPSQRPSIAQAMDVLRSADAKLPVLPATYDGQHIRSLEQQAYGDQPVEDLYEGAVNATTYLTSKDSVYLLA